MRGFPSPSRSRGKGGFSQPHQPGRAVPWKGVTNRKKVTRDPQTRCGCGISIAAMPRPSSRESGTASAVLRGSRGCSAGLPRLGVQLLRAAFSSSSRCRPPAGSAGCTFGRARAPVPSAQPGGGSPRRLPGPRRRRAASPVPGQGARRRLGCAVAAFPGKVHLGAGDAALRSGGEMAPGAEGPLAGWWGTSSPSRAGQLLGGAEPGPETLLGSRPRPGVPGPSFSSSVRSWKWA